MIPSPSPSFFTQSFIVGQLPPASASPINPLHFHGHFIIPQSRHDCPSDLFIWSDVWTRLLHLFPLCLVTTISSCKIVTPRYNVKYQQHDCWCWDFQGVKVSRSLGEAYLSMLRSFGFNDAWLLSSLLLPVQPRMGRQRESCVTDAKKRA